ncbi:SNARE associated Golgi protein [Rhizoctonia solani]|uniref:Golgi apparatus membrane protein TVP38 n=1 Tax=Rhizoctonia solani TaxID=456999 RepID=A0A8H7INF7_9AGAM|nr:SNARE associated Golgi protein [Rhizoctonia solani]
MSRNQPSSSTTPPASPFLDPQSHTSSRQQRPTFHYTNTNAHIPNLYPASHISRSSSTSDWPNEKARPLDSGVRRARSPASPVNLGIAFPSSSHTHSLAPLSICPTRSPHPLRPEYTQELRIGGSTCTCDVPDSLKPWIPMMIWALSSIAFLVAITYYKTEVFTGLDELSQWLQVQGYQGQLILFFLIFVTTFPPLPLYSTLIGLSGYCFGAMTGAIISYFAALSGALVVFLLSRTFLRWHIARLISHSPSFKRILRAIEKRPSLLFLIRLAPYPYNVMNVLLASSPRLTLTTYTACTALSLLKVIIHTSIGASIHSFADYHMREGAKEDENSGLGRAWTIIGITLCVMLFMYLSWVARRAVDELDDEDEVFGGRGPVTRSLAPMRGRRDDEEAVAFLSPAAMDESDEFVNGGARSRETDMTESPFRERSYPPTEINPSPNSRLYGDYGLDSYLVGIAKFVFTPTYNTCNNGHIATAPSVISTGMDASIRLLSSMLIFTAQYDVLVGIWSYAIYLGRIFQYPMLGQVVHPRQLLPRSALD